MPSKFYLNYLLCDLHDADGMIVMLTVLVRLWTSLVLASTRENNNTQHQ